MRVYKNQEFPFILNSVTIPFIELHSPFPYFSLFSRPNSTMLSFPALYQVFLEEMTLPDIHKAFKNIWERGKVYDINDFKKFAKKKSVDPPNFLEWQMMRQYKLLYSKTKTFPIAEHRIKQGLNLFDRFLVDIIDLNEANEYHKITAALQSNFCSGKLDYYDMVKNEEIVEYDQGILIYRLTKNILFM